MERGDRREPPQEEQLEKPQQQQEEPVGAPGLVQASMQQEIMLYDELVKRLDRETRGSFEGD